uniref:FLYWCH-type domain-containing protein n=1 Tax=Steinernema glaseri TaxID=37863 RepID=A0A1I8AIU5_9BILA
MLRQPLTVINSVTRAIMCQPYQTCLKQLFVIEDIVYIFNTFDDYRLRLLELNLRDYTVINITNNVENLTDMTCIWRAEVDGKAIYVTGCDKSSKKAMWKLEIVLLQLTNFILYCSLTSNPSEVPRPDR